jgi:hypothetical protein
LIIAQLKFNQVCEAEEYRWDFALKLIFFQIKDFYGRVENKPDID